MRKIVIPIEELCLVFNELYDEDDWKIRRAKWDLLTYIITYFGNIEGDPHDLSDYGDKTNGAGSDPTTDTENQSATLPFTAEAETSSRPRRRSSRKA